MRALAYCLPLLLGSVLSSAPAAAPSALAAPQAGEPRVARDVVALRAGTIYLVKDGAVLEGGATILLRGSKIVSIGKDLPIPPDAAVVDYGPDAVICPGFVLADSNLISGAASTRTAEPALSAVQAFDPYARYDWALASGVTSAYVTPARLRLIAGQGAIVKLAGAPDSERVVRAPASVHAALSFEARSAPGYWVPPVPPTSDVGLGVAQKQLPRSLVGATVALRELLVAARNNAPAADFGPYAAMELNTLVQQRVPWLVSVTDETEARAALALAADFGLNLVLNEATFVGALADEIAKRGAAVVYKPSFNPNTSLVNRGKSPDARWPESDTAALLARAGVRLAIAPGGGSSPRDIRFAALLSMRGGLDPAVALRAITLTPAEIYGVADRVGSLEPGKDADFVVLNGAPLEAGSSVLSTWSDGQTVWQSQPPAPEAGAGGGTVRSAPVVISADELHLGDGHVLRPGEVLLQDGKIAEVGERVARPRGATVVHGFAAMPGIVDALGHLGLEGSARAVGSEFRLSRILAPGDVADRKVARAGVTTVALSTRTATPAGVPVVAYKPAASDYESLIVREPAGVRLRWTDRNRSRSGNEVKDLLDKAQKYHAKWLEYEKALANWKPTAGKSDEAGPAEAKDDAKPAGEDKKEEAKPEGTEEKKDEKAEGDKKDDKKKKDEPEPADPVTGVWDAEVALPAPLTGKAKLRLQLLNSEGTVRGSLRCEAVSEQLVSVQGTWALNGAAKELRLSGAGTRGWVDYAAVIGKGKMAGTLLVAGWQADVDAVQTAKEYPVAARPKPVKAKEASEAPADAKGKPAPPRRDERLEPLRQALLGKAGVIVDVDRADEILACVDAFAAVGLKPVLYGADEAWKVKDKLKGRVAGVLLGLPLARNDPEGSQFGTNRYAELQAAGIPVAFHSAAEEGASDLLLRAMYAVTQGMSASGALRALTSEAARMLGLSDRVGMLSVGLDADVLLLDASPLDAPARVLRTWVNGNEVLP
jgi:imidazolonepropionase-like amidohydrolase